MKQSMWIGTAELKPIAAAYDGKKFYVSSLDENVNKFLMSSFEQIKTIDEAKEKDFDIVSEVCSRLTYSAGKSHDWNSDRWETTDKIINMFTDKNKKAK
jgi:hypothetical protein